MAFMPAQGDWTTENIVTAASTAYTVGDFMTNDGTNNIPATTTGLRNVGIILQAKAVGDTTTNPILVAVPRSPTCTFLATAGTGTLTRAMVNRTFDFASSSAIAQATDTHHQVVLRQFISASSGLFSLNSSVYTLPGA